VDLNPIVLSIPVFFILIGIELIAGQITHQKLYRLPDTIANLSCGITSQLSGLFFKILAIGVYQLLHQHFSFFEWERNWLYWLMLFLLADLAYYWAHRKSHEINLFWGGHVVHHQSEDYNLSVALRQSSFQVIWTFAFSLPLAFLGFKTWDYALMASLITLYQFWIHTETINKMGWFEYVFNTPSHHRVHHGRDPKYIDKNHAGTLIIWDKMFGTFQEEEERPTYGITKPINSWNAVWANFSHYADMGNDLKRIPKWSDKIKYLFKKPGWLPDYLGGYRSAPDVDKATYHKYESPAPVSMNFYVIFQYLICLVGTAWFLFNADKFTLGEKGIFTVLISVTVVNLGVLFEHRTWVIWSEWIRIVLYPVLLIGATYFFQLAPLYYGVALAFLIISIPWFYSINRQPSHVQVA
jgi:sterol desaturase/sphingolipid hydroxylase (fatty acid hydroxylase superfamily)